MFQENNGPKGNLNGSAIIEKDVAQNSLNEQLAKGIDNNIAATKSKVASKVAKANNVVSQVNSINNGLTPELPTNKIAKGGLWDNQPISKIHNAGGIIESALHGINRVVKLLLVIEGEVINHFKNFKLKQSAIKHHEFELILAHNSLKETENYQLETAQNFLGKRLTVVFKYKDVEESPERTFVGVITEVGFSQDKNSLGNIVLKGFSPTVLLDAAPHTQSFGGSQPISLNSVADSVIKQGIDKGKYDYRIDAKYGNINYTAQYEETHYNYLARMAEAYGEQFFYDGEVLHFGQLPPQEKPITLVYGSNISDVSVKMKAQHVKPTLYGYNSSNDEKLTTGATPIDHKSDIAKRAYNKAEKTFTTPALRLAPIRAFTSMDVNTSQKGATGSKAVDVFVTSGSTSIPYMYPGCIADIEMRKQDTNKTSYFTKLMITEVTHEVDEKGFYNGTFEGIAADTGYLPRPEFITPNAEIQIAKVVSNTDKKNQGRVQVQFDWQSGGDYTDLIRVMTPDAGSSEKVNKNRGFMSIPEVGDQVMVGFIHQNPDRPFVMGGMFHGKIGGGGGEGNNIMSFSGRSGAELKYDNGAGSMNLKDQGGASMNFDGVGNAVVNTNSDHTTNAGQHHTTNAKNNHAINAGDQSMINVGGNSVMQMDKAGNVSLTANTEFKISVGASTIIIKKDGTITINGKDVKIDATNTADFSGKTSLKVGSKKTNINGSTEVQINGSKVNINK